jgi:hypothetical protein
MEILDHLEAIEEMAKRHPWSAENPEVIAD